MERALFISSRPIYPIVGGDQIRTAQQLDLLCDLYRVDVLYLSHQKKDEEIKEYQPKVNKCVRFQVSSFTSYLYTLRFLLNKLPLQANYYFSPKVQKYIDEHIGQYDIVFCNNIRTAEYVMKYHHMRRYMDFVDAISMNYDKARKHAASLAKRLIYSIDYRRVKAYEQKVLKEFTACAVISEVDKNYIQHVRDSHNW